MNNRPPVRRGLGRGLGSLIPTTPPATEPAEDVVDVPSQVGAPDDGQRDSATALRSAPDSGTGADWIGRIPPPPPVTTLRPTDQPDDQRSGPPVSPGAAEPTGESSEVERAGVAGIEPETDGDATDPLDAADAGTATELRHVEGAHFADLPVASIHPNPRQPRQVFDEEAMAELVHSIREVGLLQPVVVRRFGADSYELIMGERRLRATQQLGLATIPAIVRETGDDALLRDALLENLHRAELNPLEEAAAYQQLLDDFGCTHDELATRIGRSRPQISNTLRLLKLSPAVQRRVAAGVLSAGHARTLLSVTDPGAQDRLANRVVAEGISVRGLEELVAVGELGPGDGVERKRRAREELPELSELTDRLSDVLDTRVKVDVGRNKGRLTIEFASLDDLHRIIGVIDRSPAAIDDRAVD